MRFFPSLLLIGAALVGSGSLTARAQAPDIVRYRVSFPNPVHHEARVEIDIPAAAMENGRLRVRMARASPGRYALHEFAKNVYDVRATDADNGRPLTITRPDPYGWDVTGGGGMPPPARVRFSYTLFGDRSDGTYVAIDAEHAHLNLPGTLAYVPALANRPQEVRFVIPDGTSWEVATQLEKVSDSVWRAPHLQYLMDSPVLLGTIRRRSWTQDGQKLELAVLHREQEVGLDSLAARTQRIVRTTAHVWGSLPRYDFGTYTFLADYLPTVTDDGMEHRNSTMLTTAGPLSKGDAEHLSTITHEFFHSWNVERLRPADLEPFDFERANMSDYLWLAEGFTTYYTGLLLRRTGEADDQTTVKFVQGLVRTTQQPGAGRFSPIEMSRQAPFVDAARSVDGNNRLNTYASYYPLGAANALALDLLLRQHFRTDLDAYMKALWQQYGTQQAGYAPTRPYKLDDLRTVLGQVSGDTAFANGFFRNHITGHETPKWAELLAPAGLLVRPTHPNKVWMGAAGLDFSDKGTTLTAGTLMGSPLYRAGLDRGDKITRIGGRRVRNLEELDKALAKLQPGTSVEIEVEPRAGSGVRRVPVALVADPTLEVVLAEAAATYKTTNGTLTDAQKAFRAAWWGK